MAAIRREQENVDRHAILLGGNMLGSKVCRCGCEPSKIDYCAGLFERSPVTGVSTEPSRAQSCPISALPLPPSAQLIRADRIQ